MKPFDTVLSAVISALLQVKHHVRVALQLKVVELRKKRDFLWVTTSTTKKWISADECVKQARIVGIRKRLFSTWEQSSLKHLKHENNDVVQR